MAPFEAVCASKETSRAEDDGDVVAGEGVIGSDCRSGRAHRRAIKADLDEGEEGSGVSVGSALMASGWGEDCRSAWASASWARRSSISDEVDIVGDGDGGDAPPANACKRAFSSSSSATRISMASNSSRFRCRLRNAAALFFTSRASRFERPDTSGGTKSLVVMRSLGRFAVTE